MKCDWELFVVRTLSIISLDLKIFVSIKVHDTTCQKVKPPPPALSPLPSLSEALGKPTF